MRKIKSIIMNRKTYDKWYRKVMSFEEDIVSQATSLLSDYQTYLAGTHKEGYKVYISNEVQYKEILAVYKDE